MYYYIYDSFLNNKKYNNVMARIENRLTDLGINGKINRLSFLKNIRQVISEEVKKGIKTIVIIGDDKTFCHIINIIADLNVVVGFIPVNSKNIAQLLNIPDGDGACDVLSARIIKKVDLASINNYYFITSIELSGKNITLDCDDDYYITLDKYNNIINISNLNYCYNTVAIADDGILDLFIESTQKRFLRRSRTHLSYFSVKQIKINSKKPLPIFLTDEKKILKTPAEINIIPKKLQMVVGKSI